MTLFDPERLLFQQGTDPLEGGAPPPEPVVIEDLGMRIERNRAVTMSDGVEIFVDLFLPSDRSQAIPALIAWGPYGKHTYMLDMDPQGRLVRWQQVLSEGRFNALKVGASRDDVLNVPGATLKGTGFLNLNGTIEKINTSVVIKTAGG